MSNAESIPGPDDHRRRAVVVPGSIALGPRATVVRMPDVPRAHVVVPPQEQVPTITSPGIEEGRKFADAYRQRMNMEPNVGFSPSDMQIMAGAWGIAPVRFILAKPSPEATVGTWYLYLSSQDQGKQATVYEPRSGVKAISLGNNHVVYNVPFNNPAEAKWSTPSESVTSSNGIRVGRIELLNAPPEEVYTLDGTFLEALGAIQQDPVNCGPLCVYAAMVARQVQ